MQLPHKPFVLVILDGWGYSPTIAGNAIAQANKPTWNHLWQAYPHTLISGSGHDVGLPDGQMGNSEVGHLNMGAGRMVPTDLVRMNTEIANGNFAKNPVLLAAIAAAVKHDKAVHILGLLSPGGVHSHEQHIMAMLQLAAAQGAKKIYLHAFLDGRDTPPKSALNSLKALDRECDQLGVGKIASIVGRYYAMDRDQRWERTQLAYDLLTQGKAEYQASTAAKALELAYARDETDEFVKPTVIHALGEQPIHIEDGDSVIFMNFRADRARQLTRALVSENFSGFARARQPKLADFVSLTEYAPDLPAHIAYRPLELNHVFAAYIAELGLKQLHIAETEKYAHVTFFFNGGREQPYPGEERILVPSPKVATYDLQPAMSAIELTDQLVNAINTKKFDVIIVNYANADMVGHSGKMEATVKAIEVLDTCLGRVVSALQAIGGELLITADHGNAEKMIDEITGQPHTAHTTNPVPLIYVGRAAEFVQQTGGTLTDVIPTLLYMMNLKQPVEMTGHNLLQIKG